MRFFLPIIFVLFIAAACRSKNHIPSNIIPEKKMQEVLWDLMRADQYLGNYVFPKDTTLNRTTESLKYYQQIFAIHNISREKFQQSFTFYRKRPSLFKSMMDSISLPTLANPGQIITPSNIITRPDTPVLVK